MAWLWPSASAATRLERGSSTLLSVQQVPACGIALRIHEGRETDQYRCDKGHEFGMDWPEPATEPQWPPPSDLIESGNS
ncbi:hypothetical protein DFR37_10880 [Eoetvoesiella caeni]|uniref:Uncharacterized protein n=1 Tax=Eoetvoesiella caeni TaxID=645616 RepID=A0A366H802_9BURK|nr:hypothetical protein DFR37_10880 [Eoetvoesiella caeni]